MMNYFKFVFVFCVLTLTNFQLFSQNALHFDGTNDRVSCGNPSELQITGTALTIEAWIKPSSFGPNNWSNNIINKEEYGNSNGYTLRCGIGGRINFNIGSGSIWNEITTSAVVLNVNTWTHVAATYDGSYMRIYINGVVTDSIVKTVNITNAASTNLFLGDYSNGNRFYHGAIDEVRIWNVTRTKAQINANMNIEICGGQPGLKGYYRLNEGIANNTNTGVITATSSAVNGVNGTLSNFALTGIVSNWVTGQPLTGATNFGGDSIYAAICQGDYYQFGSQTLTTQGTYLENFMTSAGCDSIITLFLTVNASNSVSLKDTICQGDTYILGNQQLTQAGNYTEILQNINGCDSVINLELSVRKVSLSVSVIGGGTTLQCIASPAYYQWLDCDNGNAMIPGATGQTYSPAVKGNYSVIVTQDLCSDTSVCIPISQVIGLRENDSDPFISISPNPTSGLFIISGLGPYNKGELIIYNSIGIKMATYKLKGTSLEFDISEFSKGVYFIHLIVGGQISKSKIIKQ